MCSAIACSAVGLSVTGAQKVADGFGGLIIAAVVTFGALILSRDFTPVEKNAST